MSSNPNLYGLQILWLRLPCVPRWSPSEGNKADARPGAKHPHSYACARPVRVVADLRAAADGRMPNLKEAGPYGV